jgi:hypothetical protein
MSWATQQLTSRGLTACRNATKYSASTALAVLSLAVAQPAWAQTTNPNPPPPPVSVPFKQTSTLGAAQSAQQYTAAIINNNNKAGLSANATGATAQVVALTDQHTESDTAVAAFTAKSVGLTVMVAYEVASIVTGIPGNVAAAAAAGLFAASSTSLRCFQSCSRINRNVQ